MYDKKIYEHNLEWKAITNNYNEVDTNDCKR